MKCPNCRLENPPTAMWCDCGYVFKKRKVDPSLKYVEPDRPNHKPKWNPHGSGPSALVVELIKWFVRTF